MKAYKLEPTNASVRQQLKTLKAEKQKAKEKYAADQKALFSGMFQNKIEAGESSSDGAALAGPNDGQGSSTADASKAMATEN